MSTNNFTYDITYEDAVEAILQFQRFTETPSVEHTRSMLDEIGAPDHRLKIIHVAGTNGKGSVCAFLTNMLMSQGYRVGTFTSPHLVKMNERIKLNDEPVDNETFLQAYLNVKTLGRDPARMNYFEYLFVMAMDIFGRSNLDYVILEVGMGGRLDGTNSIAGSACSVITSISFDHVEILGSTIQEIASAKAGIIRPGTPVVYDAVNPEAARVIAEEAAKLESPSYAVDAACYELAGRGETDLSVRIKKGIMAGQEVTIPFIADYQAGNTTLALGVMEVLGHLKTPEQKTAALRGLMNTRWPGRMQQVMPGVYLDGAHNEDGIAKFVQTVNKVPCKGRKYLLFSAVKEKDVELMARHLGLETDFAHIIITEVDSDRQLGTGELANRLKHYFDGPVTECADIRQALEQSLSMRKEEDLLFIAGSLYLAGSIMELL